jgi:hypothetical protein
MTIPEQTLLHGNDTSDYKQLTIERWAYETLKNWSNRRNGTMSKGVVLYEAILFEYDEEVTDVLSATESALDTELERQGVATEQIESITQLERTEARDQLRNKVADDPDEKLRDVKIWLPETVDSQVPWERGWNEKITSALVSVYMSKYSDRADRIRCKREILNHVTSDMKPSHPVATELVEAGIAEPELKTVDDYKQHCDDITQWNERFDTLRQLYAEYDELLKKLLVDTVQETHGIGEQYARDKIDEFAEVYELYEYAPVSEVEVTQEEFPELVDRYGSTDENLAVLVNGLLECYEADGQRKPLVADVADQFKKANLVSTNKETGRLIQELDSNHGLPAFKKIDQGKIYFTSHTAHR